MKLCNICELAFLFLIKSPFEFAYIWSVFYHIFSAHHCENEEKRTAMNMNIMPDSLNSKQTTEWFQLQYYNTLPNWTWLFIMLLFWKIYVYSNIAGKVWNCYQICLEIRLYLLTIILLNVRQYGFVVNMIVWIT